MHDEWVTFPRVLTRAKLASALGGYISKEECAMKKAILKCLSFMFSFSSIHAVASERKDNAKASEISRPIYHSNYRNNGERLTPSKNEPSGDRS